MELGYHDVTMVFVRRADKTPVKSVVVRRKVRSDVDNRLWIKRGDDPYGTRVKEINGRLVALVYITPKRNPVDDHYTPHPQGLHRVWVKTIYGDKLRLYRPDGRPVTDPDRPYHHLEK